MAGATLTAGALMRKQLGAQTTSSRRLSKGDMALLRFAAAVELMTRLTFPDLNALNSELTQTDLILPEPCDFHRQGPPAVLGHQADHNAQWWSGRDD